MSSAPAFQPFPTVEGDVANLMALSRDHTKSFPDEMAEAVDWNVPGVGQN